MRCRNLTLIMFSIFLLTAADSTHAQTDSYRQNPDPAGSPYPSTNDNAIQGGIRVWQSQNNQYQGGQNQSSLLQSNTDEFGSTKANYQVGVDQTQVGLSPANLLTGSEDDIAMGCRKWLERYHPKQLALLSTLNSDEILEIPLHIFYHDRIGKFLDLFNVPHTIIKASELEKHLFNRPKIILLNGSYGIYELPIHKDKGLLLKDFVYNGGYLVATAQACKIVEKIFPDYLNVKLSYSFTPDTFRGGRHDMYEGSPNLDIEPALINSNLLLGCPPFSEMHNGLSVIKATSSADTVILTSCWQSRLRLDSGAAAIVFAYGKGKVLCYPGFLRPASTSLYASSLVRPYLNLPYGMPMVVPGHALVQLADYMKSPKQIGAAQFVAINFILERLQKPACQISTDQANILNTQNNQTLRQNN